MMLKTMKLAEIINLFTAINSIQTLNQTNIKDGKPNPQKISYGLSRTKSNIAKYIEVYEAERKNLINEFATKELDEDGNPTDNIHITPQGTVKFDDVNAIKFETAHTELINTQEKDVELYELHLADFEKMDDLSRYNPLPDEIMNVIHVLISD